MNETDPVGVRHLFAIADLDRGEVDQVLSAAAERGGDWRPSSPFTAGLVFLTSSLRTRSGFAVAVQRLGGAVVDVTEARYDSSMSDPESLDDTLRTLGELCDVLVCRASVSLLDVVHRAAPGCPVINGGDLTGHPTQALIDLWTISQTAGGVDGRRIGLCGDVSMRAARSLLDVLALFAPAEVVLIAPPERMLNEDLIPDPLRTRTTRRDRVDFIDLDVLYLPGLPPGNGPKALSPAQRRVYALGPHTIGSLPSGAVVLSPLPIIDEIDPVVTSDSRVQPWATHRHSTPVRMAILEYVLGRA